MSTEVVMPQMGESIAEGTITKWLKKVGERVERDEPLFEISTDKVDAEIPSPAAGVLTEVRFNEGDTVEVNSVVAVLDGEGGQTVSAPPAVEEAKPAEIPQPKVEPPLHQHHPRQLRRRHLRLLNLHLLLRYSQPQAAAAAVRLWKKALKSYAKRNRVLSFARLPRNMGWISLN
jgi:pyruvate/2-oxoglutarate dehydrogenase complex dihydrolipoamide acyltransferase (E2) component